MSDKGIDLGVCICDSEAALRYYRDTVGLEHVAALAFPTGVMHRLQCDTLLVKLIGPDEPPAAASAGIGFRYFTMTVPGLDAIMARCEAGGYTTVLSR